MEARIQGLETQGPLTRAKDLENKINALILRIGDTEDGLKDVENEDLEDRLGIKQIRDRLRALVTRTDRLDYLHPTSNKPSPHGPMEAS